MYWMLECYRASSPTGRSIEDSPDVPGVESWCSGARFDADVPQPIELFWDPDDEDGPPQHLFKAGIPLMSRTLLEAFHEAGVTNIDTYEAVIRSHRDPLNVCREFVAFNIVGLVAAADMSKSKYSAPIGPPLVCVDFESVVIDEKAARGALLFRLAECVSAVVVHDRVKRHLESRDLGLSFEKPEDWSG